MALGVFRRGVIGVAGLALTVGVLGQGSPAVAETSGADSTTLSAQTSGEGVVAGQGVQRSSLASAGKRKAKKNVQVRLVDKTAFGYLKRDCTVSVACPTGEQKLLNRGSKYAVKGRVKPQFFGKKLQEVPRGSKVRLHSAAITYAGGWGTWLREDVAKLQADGSFRMKYQARDFARLLRVELKVADEVTGSKRAKVTKDQVLAVGRALGVGMTSITFDNESKHDLDLSMQTKPVPGCTDNGNPCYETLDVTVGSKSTQKVVYIAPQQDWVAGWSMQKTSCFGFKCSTYIPDWDAGKEKHQRCANVNPSPAAGFLPGSEWSVTFKKKGAGYNGFLDGPDMPAASKKNDPNGCSFQMGTAFQNWFANNPVWGWLAVVAAAVVAVAIVLVAWPAIPEAAAGAGAEAGELAATSGVEVAEDSDLVGNLEDWKWTTTTDNDDVVVQVPWHLGGYN